MGEVEAKGDRVKRYELRRDRNTVSMLTEHFIFSPKYRGKVLLGEVGEAAEEMGMGFSLKYLWQKAQLSIVGNSRRDV